MNYMQDCTLTTISLLDRCNVRALEKTVLSHPGCVDPIAFRLGLAQLIKDGMVGISYGVRADDDVIFYVDRLDKPSPEDEREYTRACRIHRRRMFWAGVRFWLSPFRWFRK